MQSGPKGEAGDAMSQVILDQMNPLFAQSAEKDKAAFVATGSPELLPWVQKLLDPLKIDGTNFALFGDERAYMASVVALECEKGQERPALLSVHDGDLFRLAEADSAGDGGYNYQKPFLDTLRDKYFYQRHAPDPSGKFGNSTLHLMSQHHLCAIGAGEWAAGEMAINMRLFYRHMQFLCIYEYFRLIQFSQRLSRIVRGMDEKTVEFRKAVLEVRQDFLTHTHLHHFENVSSQLQPHEMYEKLQVAMGLPGMFDELSRELHSAAEFAAMSDAREQAERIHELNAMVGVAAPVGIAATIAGVRLGNDAILQDYLPADVSASHPLIGFIWVLGIPVAIMMTALWLYLQATGSKSRLKSRAWQVLVIAVLVMFAAMAVPDIYNAFH